MQAERKQIAVSTHKPDLDNANVGTHNLFFERSALCRSFFN
jgi:hypothetical protein